jgi:alpha-L-rhamnosidase
MDQSYLLLVTTSKLTALVFALVCSVTVAASTAHTSSSPSAGKLLTEYLEDPLGIDSPEPRLSWQFVQDVRGARQSAYQIKVADSLQALESGNANVWDSGKVESSQSTNIPLPGGQLRSGARYYWRVTVWDAQDAESDFSEPAWFEMGLLSEGDWKGVWLTVPGGGNGYHSAMDSNVDVTKWVQIDLGESIEFSAVKLFPARPYNWHEDTPGFGFPVRYRLEASDEPEFKNPVVFVDKTDADQPNPKNEPVTHEFAPTKARYVRLTVARLYTRIDGQKLFALAEMQVLDPSGTNVAQDKPVSALDSTEDNGWGMVQLTEGLLHSTEPMRVAPLFRHEFDMTKPVKRARAFVTGLGYYELHLNGRKVGDRVLDPAYTTFGKRVLYSTYDVTDQLVQGRNAVGAILGKGWFNEAPCVLLQLNIEFEDGTSASVTTNPEWKRGKSHILENTLYHGETCDARLEQRGWDVPGFDDSGWDPVLVRTSPTKNLSAEMIQPIKVVEDITPTSLSNPKEGVWVYDFGQNFSGWCRLKVSGPAGTEVVLKHAELVYPDGTVNQENLRSARATDRYVLKGGGVETWEPRFTYHGFRYVQLEGFPGKPDLKTLTGQVVHTSFARRGAFECSKRLINRIHSNACWGYRTNWHSIPTDCPQRDERQGWMGDAHMTAETGLYNFDVAPAYSKFLQDIQDAQGEDGRIPDTVPHMWGSDPGDPMWSAAYHFITWDMYRHTGDLQLLEKHYDGMKRYVDMLGRETGDYIIGRNNYGDWVGVVETPKDLISTGSFYRVSWIVSHAARILGKFKDARKYDDLCSKIAEAFNARFFHPETNTYGNGSQFSNAWPLFLGIVPPATKKAVLDNLVHDIVVNHKGHLSTGFMGARPLLEVLCSEGYADIAYGIVTKEDYPGWGYMIANGATTIWELWKMETGPGMNSHNHPAFGFVGGWFYRALAGIAPDFRDPGFERFDIKPFVVGDLKEARASVETVRGLVESHWKHGRKDLTLDVAIPANSRASVWVPKAGLSDVEVREGSTVVWRKGKFVPILGIDSTSDAGAWVRFEVGSGRYHFQLTGV